MATKGAEKQEKKISEFAEIANSEFPDIGIMSFKGAFRWGAKNAVENSRFEDWQEVVKQPPAIRREFFKNLLEESKPHLKKLIGEDSVNSLLDTLLRENEKYLQD
mgnify:CR=1 FL=1